MEHWFHMAMRGGLVAVLLVWAGVAPAQKATFTPVTIPQSDTADNYQSIVGRKAVSTVTYVKDYSGDLLGPEVNKKKRAQIPGRVPLISGQSGVMIIIGICLLAIVLFFYFGGGGALLARSPRDIRAKQQTRSDWEVDADLGPDGIEAMLRRMAGSKDRTRALVQLLRHSLLRASVVTGVLFARSDTEREALRRLPEAWISQTGIATLLQHTELAHYGGREVDNTSFETCLKIATAILRAKGAKHA